MSGIISVLMRDTWCTFEGGINLIAAVADAGRVYSKFSLAFGTVGQVILVCLLKLRITNGSAILKVAEYSFLPVFRR
jgi:hypothetical protein